MTNLKTEKPCKTTTHAPIKCKRKNFAINATAASIFCLLIAVIVSFIIPAKFFFKDSLITNRNHYDTLAENIYQNGIGISDIKDDNLKISIINTENRIVLSPATNYNLIYDYSSGHAEFVEDNFDIYMLYYRIPLALVIWISLLIVMITIIAVYNR